MKRYLSIIAGALMATASSGSQAEDLRNGGKLLLTNGVTTIEGSSGGGLASWAVIAGNETRDGVGISAHLTAIELPDYSWRSYGAAVGIRNRVELSYARQNLDTEEWGAALGIGRGYVFSQDVFAAKVRLFGDAVYGPALRPQIAIGIQHKKSANDGLVRAVGADRTSNTEVYLSATKLFLAHSLLIDTTLRLTRANQTGLLGHDDDRTLQFEGSAAYQFSRRFVVGAEYRTKPDNLAFAKEQDWLDIFAAYALTDHLTVTAAYVDLGSIATSDPQRGAFFQIQTAF